MNAIPKSAADWRRALVVALTTLLFSFYLTPLIGELLLRHQDLPNPEHQEMREALTDHFGSLLLFGALPTAVALFLLSIAYYFVDRTQARVVLGIAVAATLIWLLMAPPWAT
jgi:predicted permease